MTGLPARVRPWLVAAILAVAGGLAFLVALPEWNERQGYDAGIYAGAIHRWLSGAGTLYDFVQPDEYQGELRFSYPPFAGIVLLPIELVPEGAWRSALLIVGILAAGVLGAWLVAGGLLPQKGLGTIPTAALGGAIAVVGFASEPWARTLGFGQVNLLLLLLVAVDVLVLERRGSRWAGVGIGLAMAIKLTPGVFLGYLILRRRWRALGVAVGTFAASVLLSLAVMPGVTWEYFTSRLWSAGLTGEGPLIDQANVSITGSIARLAYPDAAPAWIPYVVLAVVVAIAAVRLWRTPDASPAAAAAVVGLLAVLAPSYGWSHHAVWAVPAVFVAVISLLPGRDDPSPRWWRVLIAVALILGAVIVWTPLYRLPGGFDAEIISPAARALLDLPTIWMIAAVALLPLRLPRAPALPWARQRASAPR